MKPPKLNRDGSCPACIGGWLCAYHQRESHVRERRQAEAIRQAVIGIRAAEIGRICARFELESDEFYTREQKAERLLS